MSAARRPAAPNAGVPRLRATASPMAAARVAAGLTQPQVAARVGLSLRRYQRVEADIRLVLPHEAEAIACHLGARLGRAINPYEEFVAHLAPPDRQSGAGGGTPARGGLRVLSGGAVERAASQTSVPPVGAVVCTFDGVDGDAR